MAMKKVPLNETPLEKEEKTDASCTVPKKEIAKTLSALADDYSDLISERGKADNLHFAESVPQPTAFKKSNNLSFYESDCEKIIDGKYTVNGEKTGNAEGNCIALTYDEPIKETGIYEPVIKKYQRPVEPTYEKPKFLEHPVMLALSVVSFALMIGLLIVGIVVNFMALYAEIVAITGFFIFTGKSYGGVIAAIIYLFRLPVIKKHRKEDMKEYKRQLDRYAKKVEAAQTEYDSAMQDYERQVAEADKEYESKCEELYKSVLKAIEEYIVVCKEYFKRKKQAEEENEKQKAIIRQRYEAIAGKIQAYPEIIPPKFLKVPEFEKTSCYDLEKVESELKAYVDILESGRADTLKEATNCYIADKQAEEQKRILENQAMEQRWQAEEQRRQSERQAQEQRELMEQQAKEQREHSMEQNCSTNFCPFCIFGHGHLCYSYESDGHGGCSSFSKRL